MALDTQMHRAAGSGNSLIDYLFYFLPPTKGLLGRRGVQQSQNADNWRSKRDFGQPKHSNGLSPLSDRN